MTSRSDAQPSSKELLLQRLRTWPLGEIGKEAADEIERLQAEKEQALYVIERMSRAASEPSALQQELAVTNKLLDERNRLLDAIPECPVHGRQCVPHAIEWVKERESIPPKLARWRCVSYCLCDPSTTKGHFVRDDVSGTWVKYDDIGSGSAETSSAAVFFDRTEEFKEDPEV
jgi:hypothetical protein